MSADEQRAAKNRNAAAFARPCSDNGSTHVWEQAQAGLTKREFFAAMALQGILANVDDARYEDAATDAVNYADALMVELERGES